MNRKDMILVTAEYYSETLSLTDMDDKAGAEKLQGFWAVEIGELAGMKKADIEKVKAFLSTRDDKYRPSYGRVVESHPRQCVIIATVNGEAEIWCECFNKNLQELKPSDSYAIAAMMSQIDGWERTTQIKRQHLYGRQRLYKRT